MAVSSAHTTNVGGVTVYFQYRKQTGIVNPLKIASDSNYINTELNLNVVAGGSADAYDGVFPFLTSSSDH